MRLYSFVHFYDWLILLSVMFSKCFPGSSVVKNLPANAGDVGSVSESGRSPGEGNGKPLQYSCLDNSTEEPDGLQSIGSQRVGHD